MSFRKKIRIAAFKQQDAETPFFIREWNQMAGPHAGMDKVFVKLSAGFFAVGIDFLIPLRNQKRFTENRAPLQDFSQATVLRIVSVELRAARHRFQVNPSALIERNGSTFISDHGRRTIHDGLEDTV